MHLVWSAKNYFRHLIFEYKHLGCMFQSSVRHSTTHLPPCDLCDVLPGWGLTDTSISLIHLMKLFESVCSPKTLCRLCAHRAHILVVLSCKTPLQQQFYSIYQFDTTALGSMGFLASYPGR